MYLTFIASDKGHCLAANGGRGIFAAENIALVILPRHYINTTAKSRQEDLTPREIKTDGAPRPLLRRKRIKRHAADAFHSFLLIFFCSFLSRPPSRRHENKLTVYVSVNVSRPRRTETAKVLRAAKLLTSKIYRRHPRAKCKAIKNILCTRRWNH